MSLDTLNVKIDRLIEKAGTKADYNQNDETASDYIKNRPFYKYPETKVYTEDNYKTPFVTVEATDDSPEFKIYKISDVPIPISQINNTVCKAHSYIEIDGEIQYIDNLPWHLYDDNGYQGSDEIYIKFYADGDNASLCMSSNILLAYETLNGMDLIGVDIQLTKGIYVVLSNEQDADMFIVLDEITSYQFKKIDDSFLPDSVRDSFNKINAKFDDYNTADYINGNYLRKETANSLFYKKSEADSNFLNINGLNNLLSNIFSSLQYFDYLYQSYVSSDKIRNDIILPSGTNTRNGKSFKFMFYETKAQVLSSTIHLDNAVCIRCMFANANLENCALKNMSSKCVHFDSLFQNSSMKTIVGELDFSGLPTTSGTVCPCCGLHISPSLTLTFYNAPIENVKFKEESIPASNGGLIFNKAVNLSDDSIKSLINGLITYNTENPKPLSNTNISLPSNIVKKLTDEQLDIIYKKGWKVG